MRQDNRQTSHQFHCIHQEQKHLRMQEEQLCQNQTLTDLQWPLVQEEVRKFLFCLFEFQTQMQNQHQRLMKATKPKSPNKVKMLKIKRKINYQCRIVRQKKIQQTCLLELRVRLQRPQKMKKLKEKRRKKRKKTKKVLQKLILQKMLILNFKKQTLAFSFIFQANQFLVSLLKNTKLSKQLIRLTKISFKAKLVVITIIKGALRQLT